MYEIKLLASAYNERKILPEGAIRQKIKHIITALAANPRPGNSTELRFNFGALGWQPRRIKIDSWRILYAVDDTAQQAIVLAIRKGVLDEDNNCTQILGDSEYHYC
jgi:mRNA-degrading endonuclease RelE of RelBE toxin-antitoxin system